MARRNTFTFRVDQDERKMLAALAWKRQRSQSDVIRLLIREAAKDISSKSSHSLLREPTGAGNANSSK